jgi:hypothetical protein
MRFPHYLFGFPMTLGLWYVLILLAALLVYWILQKVFKNLVKDFAGGMVIFFIIALFLFLAVSLVSGADSISSGVGEIFENVIP